jgi:CRISPR-associated exonuclease Cas4
VEDEKKNFDMTYWINPDRSELFFAKKVILVEGATDKTIIPYLADQLGVFRYDFTLIDCGSKDSMPNYIHLLNKFSISYVVVYDLDHQAEKTPDAKAVADRISEKIENLIDSSLGRSVIFENDIEEELQVEKTKPYMTLTQVKNTDYVLQESLKEKIKIIYS